jgi:hypothetical protein
MCESNQFMPNIINSHSTVFFQYTYIMIYKKHSVSFFIFKSDTEHTLMIFIHMKSHRYNITGVMYNRNSFCYSSVIKLHMIMITGHHYFVSNHSAKSQHHHFGLVIAHKKIPGTWKCNIQKTANYSILSET